MSGRPDLSAVRLRGMRTKPSLVKTQLFADLVDVVEWAEWVEDVLRLYVQTDGCCGARWWRWCCERTPGHDGKHVHGIFYGEWTDASHDHCTPSPWTAERLAVLHAVTNPDPAPAEETDTP